MVENQCGLRLISRSTAASVMVRPQAIMPGADDPLHAAAEPHVAVGVLADRPAAEVPGQEDPDGKVADQAKRKKKGANSMPTIFAAAIPPIIP